MILCKIMDWEFKICEYTSTLWPNEALFLFPNLKKYSKMPVYLLHKDEKLIRTNQLNIKYTCNYFRHYYLKLHKNIPFEYASSFSVIEKDECPSERTFVMYKNKILDSINVNTNSIGYYTKYFFLSRKIMQ